METKITSQTETEVQFTVTVGEKELAPIKTEVFNDMRRRVKAAGFRPGKAPDMIVERELGSSTVQGEFIEHAIQHTYVDSIKEQKLAVVGSPNVSLEKFVPYTELQYKVTVELMPKVKLGDYKSLKIKRPSVKIDPKEISRTVEELRRRVAARLDSEQPAVKGNEVNFDFEGTRGGTPVPGASSKNQTLQLGSGSFIPGFEEELTGLKKGDEKTFDIRFPKNYHESSLADQVVTFKVKLSSVTDLVLPELNDDFAKEVGPFTSMLELNEDITSKITGEKSEAAAKQYETEVLDKLLKDSTYKTPGSLVDQQLQRMRSELEQSLASSGLTVDKYLELTNKTAEDMTREMKPEAERRVGLAMVLTEVAEQEHLAVSPGELDAEIARLKTDYPDPQTQQELDNPNTREEVYNHLMASKVIAKILSYSNGK
ncbi:MAG TPA: trigger factor [Candidatus Saccharimonadia bacterium]|nr:trigger factor [Candidatus Saccharimonadia bacterium]